MGKALISGATGWLGRETIRKVVSGSFKEIDSSNLILQSSKNRVVDFGNGFKFPVQEFNGHLAGQEIMGFVHLAFLTREKVTEYGFENYAIRNLQLISSACQVIRRMKPKWVVLVSSGAIFDRESGNMEDDLVRNPYGYLKRIEELALTDAAKDVNANIVIGRLWGAAGIEMPINRAYAVSDFIEQAFYDKKIHINSGGNVFRKYCDAGEFMEVLIKLALKGESTTLDSGGDVVELEEVAKVIASKLGDVSISRSDKSSEVDDYYPRSMDFETFSNSVGVSLSKVEDIVSKTIESHKLARGYLKKNQGKDNE